jgi:methionyl-tRNA formyltransferase
MPLKVALLRSDAPHHRYLGLLLARRFEIVAVVVEPAVSQRRRLLRRGRYRDYAAHVYHLLRRRLLGLEAYRRGSFAALHAVEEPTAADPLTVEWINDVRARDLLASARPQATVVIGTSILDPELLAAAGPVVLNVHGGYLPDYRGNHCVFFALYEGAFDRIGATIHFIDAGIDTGDIVEVVRPPIEPEDTAETLYCRGEMLAFHRLAAWLQHYEKTGELPRSPQPRRGRLYRMRDRTPYHDLALWLRRKTGRLELPRHASAAGAGEPRSAEEAVWRAPAP